MTNSSVVSLVYLLGNLPFSFGKIVGPNLFSASQDEDIAHADFANGNVLAHKPRNPSAAVPADI